MSEKYRPYWGKDGNHYSDYYDMQAANIRYEQRQKLIEEQQKANKLMEEQNNRIKNENINNLRTGTYSSNHIPSNVRSGPLFLILTLIIAALLIFSGMAIKYGIYILISGLVIEAISAYKYNKKIQVTNHFFEISILVVAVLCFIITISPISTIKNILPVANKTYTIYASSGFDKTIEINSFEVENQKTSYGKIENLDIDKKVKVIINYSEYVGTYNKWLNQTKIVDFYPRTYFDELEKNATISDNLDELYMISIDEIFKNY